MCIYIYSSIMKIYICIYIYIYIYIYSVYKGLCPKDLLTL